LSYEWIKDTLKKRSGSGDELSVGKTLFAGGIAGIFNWLVAIPPDVLKSRYQSATRSMTISYDFVVSLKEINDVEVVL
uniref:Mitochondrial carrier domain-containing protein n=1 Tax=Echinostoma caproni TaxID=27848 RepID=A0A183A7Q8_9TREM